MKRKLNTSQVGGTDLSMNEKDVKIAVLEAKVDHLIGHVKELTLRVRANEKVVASVSLLGVIACTIVGAGYFAPKAEAEVTDTSFSASRWIQEMRDWKSRQTRTPIDETLNSALIMHEEETYGCDDPTEQEELLQFPSGEDKQGSGWRYDRRDPGPGIQSDEEGESQNCRCGHSREEDEEQGREGPWDRRNELDEGEVDGDY